MFSTRTNAHSKQKRRTKQNKNKRKTGPIGFPLLSPSHDTRFIENKFKLDPISRSYSHEPSRNFFAVVLSRSSSTSHFVNGNFLSRHSHEGTRFRSTSAYWSAPKSADYDTTICSELNANCPNANEQLLPDDDFYCAR